MLLESSKGGHTSVVKLLLDFPKTYGSLPPENSQVRAPSLSRSLFSRQPRSIFHSFIVIADRVHLTARVLRLRRCREAKSCNTCFA